MAIDLFSPKNTKAKDFRTVFSNTIGYQFNGAELIIRFGIIHNMADENAGLEEQVAVAMSPGTAKGLMYSLKAVIESFEATNNTTIPLSPALVELVDKAIEAASKAKKSK